DLTESLKKVINTKKNQFIYQHVFPKFDINEPFLILTDSKWNELILDQVISNAIKYSMEEKTSHYVYFDIQKQKEMTILSIKDEGIGIPEYDISRVFEPFFTGENGRKYKNSTGIGLYVCAEIAQKLGHKIEIQSDLNQGTVVKISYLSKM
ncbi:MAG: sensory transduction histidine kinase, partial [Oscillospiraceae bacterium]|nr:sensory transduction histidine kinase [Oscillospiraceae bacterium]